MSVNLRPFISRAYVAWFAASTPRPARRGRLFSDQSAARSRMISFFLLCLLLAFDAPGDCHAAGEPLVVGLREVPPFVMRQADGEYTGISIDLWLRVARELGLEYRFQDTDLSGLLKGLETGRLDVAVAALTVTAEREKLVDFTHPFHSSGLAIAVPKAPTGALAVLKATFSWQFLQALAA